MNVKGMLAHQDAREQPCGWCLQAEQVARLTAESLRPAPRQEATRQAILLAEVEAFEVDHPEGYGRRSERGHLRRIV